MRGKEESWWNNEDRNGRNEDNRSGYNIFSSTDLSPRVQNYLVRVYGNLALTTGVASAAAFLSFQRIASDFGGMGLIASFALIFGIQLSHGRVGERFRLAMLLAFGFLQGLSLGPLLTTVFAVDSDLVFMAVVGTMLAFVSFTGAALFSPRRSFLYLGGLLSFTVFIVMISSLIPSLFNFNLYLGLFLFCFYIIYDTQVLVEQAEMRRGAGDSVSGALQLFTNLMAIFVRLMVILMNNSKKQESKKRSKK